MVEGIGEGAVGWLEKVDGWMDGWTDVGMSIDGCIICP